MTKLSVLETYFNTIYDSIEWAEDCKEKEYFNFIDGVTTMTQNMLDKLNELTDEKIEDSSKDDITDWMKPRPEIVPRPKITPTPVTNSFKEVVYRCIDTE